VAAGVNVTFKILYNRAVAMTGGQDVTGLMDVPALTRALEAEGVTKVVVCSEDPERYGRRARWASGVEVLGRERLADVQDRLRDVPGVTVIVYDQRCAAETRRLRKRGLLPSPPRRVFINEGVCEGCGDCNVKSNCLSVVPIETEFGEKRQIHDASCNRDYTCLEGDCPSFVTLAPARVPRRGPGRSRSGRGNGSRSVNGNGSGNGVLPLRPSLPTGVLPDPPLPSVKGSFGIYFTGIGGTGVVTANRILVGASEAAGLSTHGMDQTGLSQKAGAVVSHLHLATTPDELGAAAIGPGGADLYLSGDILQAANPAHLAKARAGHTVAVIDENVTRTTAMLQGGVATPDVARLKSLVTTELGDGVLFLDSKGIAEATQANHLFANVVLLGAAFQLGGLPLSLADLEHALGRQGDAAQNRAAFEWGRWAVHDPAAVQASLAGCASKSIWDPSPEAAARAARLVGARRVPEALRDLLTRRAAQVIDYQDAARAGRFLDLVEKAAARDDEDHGWALTRTVAESWFKLLTYKDEYEVARLHMKVDYDAVARELGLDGPYSVTYHLHPPTLRRMGLRKKLPLGKTYELAFRALARLRRLRETPLDPFRWDPDRKTERALVQEYAQLVTDACRPGSPADYETLVQVAASPQRIKGYAQVKERAVASWRDEVAGLQREQAGAGRR
jgi:indolepyruvate ferredoxin oxidoreductase